MSVKRKAKIILLPTNEKADLQKFGRSLRYKFNHVNSMVGEYQHLYITTDDEIKEGDWMINTNEDTLIRYNSVNEGDGTWREFWRKVIATTDSSLSPKIHKGEVVDRSYPKEFRDAILPQPSQNFIQKFVEAYSVGNPITDVLVEYEKGLSEPLHKALHNPSPLCFERLKVNPKDNTITITRVKDSWSREEVKTLLNNLETKLSEKSGYYKLGLNNFNFDKWIEKNL